MYLYRFRKPIAMSTLAPPAVQPAGLFRRLGAIFYDALLLFAILCIATMLVLPLNGGAAIQAGNPLYFSYVYLSCFCFYGWFWTHGGQTLGMRAWQLRLQCYDGENITWWQAGLRFVLASLWLWPLILSEVVLRDIVSLEDIKLRVKINLVIGLGFLFLLLLTRLHDRYSETVLVRVPEPTARRSAAPSS
jgi:uncharacterized RDD family membrane protein YckC